MKLHKIIEAYAQEYREDLQTFLIRRSLLSPETARGWIFDEETRRIIRRRKVEEMKAALEKVPMMGG